MKSVNKTKTLALALLLFGVLALTPAAKANVKVDVVLQSPSGPPIAYNSGEVFTMTFRIENNNTNGGPSGSPTRTDESRTNSGTYNLSTTGLAGLEVVSGPTVTGPATTSGTYGPLGRMNPSSKMPVVTLTWTFRAPTGPASGTITLTATLGSTDPSRSFNAPPDQTSAGVSYAVTVNAPADATPPVVTGTLFPAPNAADWNNSDVLITWSASDPDSSITSGPTPSSTTVTTEGAGQLFTATATSAGGTGTGSVTVNIDKTAPTTSATPGGTAGSGSWWISDVTVALSATDGISGVTFTEYSYGGAWSTYTGPLTISSEGTTTVYYRSTDKADNAEATNSLAINIDKSIPSLTLSPAGTKGNDPWFISDVIMTLVGDDAGSGFDRAEYKLDDEDYLPYSVPFLITGDGVHTLSCRAFDEAGNEYDLENQIIKIDATAPTITCSAATADGPYTSGTWTNLDVTVTFSAEDPAPGSGLASVTDPVTVSSQGKDQFVSGTATDVAGNNSTVKFEGINIDKTAPVTTASFSGAKSAVAGYTDWYVQFVTVTLSATDNPEEYSSGVKEIHYLWKSVEHAYTGEFTISDQGEDTLTYWAVDNAGNMETPKDPTTIKIDTMPPVVTPTLPNTGHGVGVYLLGEVVDAAWSAEDPMPGSGLATAPAEGTIALDTSFLGAQTLTIPTGTAIDNAGNESQAVSVTYYVEYGFNGLLSPYQAPPKSYKINSSIPLKWQYTNASGTPVDSPDADPFPFIWLGSRTTMPDPEGEPPLVLNLNDPGSSGLRYDSLTKTWQYNWQTKGLTVGTYAIFVQCGESSQISGPFLIQLKK